MNRTTKSRSPEEIRQSIVETRQDLVQSVERLRDGMRELTDWRSRVVENKKAAVIGAVVAGFVIGGGIAAIGGALFRGGGD